jgi:hypothetical protein
MKLGDTFCYNRVFTVNERKMGLFIDFSHFGGTLFALII